MNSFIGYKMILLNFDESLISFGNLINKFYKF